MLVSNPVVCICIEPLDHCVVPRNVHGRSREIPRGRGVFKAKFLEAMYDNIPEFLGGGMQNNKPSMTGVWIFPGTAHSK